MSKFAIQINRMGDSAILIEWPQRIGEFILDDVIGFKDFVLKTLGSRLINHTPAYASLLLQYDQKIDFEKEKIELEELYQNKSTLHKQKQKEWHIPVCYHPSLALDLKSFEKKNISHRELIDMHKGAQYRVYMIGFLPGFLYLGGLPEQLHLPRKATPNLKTPKGAIAIGGQQTGIYPIESPGGWHVIGRTPLSLFDIDSDVPTPIKQGDYVFFYEIDLETFEVLKD